MAAKRIKLDQSKENDKNTYSSNKNEFPYRLTKIVCTIGPTSRTPEILEEMIEAGMSIARLNFSHGTHEYHAESIKNVRTACANYSRKIGKPVSIAIALDTTGSEIRTGLLEGGGTAEVQLKTGSTIKLTYNKVYAEKSNEQILYVGYPRLEEQVKVGTRILIDDGLIALICTSKTKGFLVCKVENGGLLGSKKGVYLEGVAVDLPVISEKDRSDLKFGIQQGIDMIFASFMRSADAFHEIREFLGDEGKNILLVSKIENRKAMDNMDEIIRVSDGIMIDRGDLGTEIPVEQVFVAQKSIVAKCNKMGTPVIIATQLLESMVSNPKPTRAEISDIANAVLDGADCVMLSGETAKGDYPLECVKTMDKVCKEAEAIFSYEKIFAQLTLNALSPQEDLVHAAAIAAVQASFQSSAVAIVVLTRTGRSAYLISKYRAKCPILAVSRNRQVLRQTQIYKGIIPVVYENDPLDQWEKDVNARIQYGINYGKDFGFVRAGDRVVVVTGWTSGSGCTNTVRISIVQ